VALGQQLTPQLIAGGLMIGLGVLVSMIAPERLSRRFVKSAPQRVET
jgi:hypothetical protein